MLSFDQGDHRGGPLLLAGAAQLAAIADRYQPATGAGEIVALVGSGEGNLLLQSALTLLPDKPEDARPHLPDGTSVRCQLRRVCAAIPSLCAAR